jgi:hypothetical protein
MVLVMFEAPPGFDPAVADERNFYFAVKDWYIRGSCYCNGQSAECNREVIYKVEITNASCRLGHYWEECKSVLNKIVLYQSCCHF